MKKIFIMLVLISTSALAEPSFNQIEALIANHQFGAAQSGLEQITQNHPQSAKAFYAMAQVKAGLGNPIGAKESLDRAIGLDPELKFADKNEVKALQVSITPKYDDVKPVTESHFPYSLLFVLALAAIGLWFVRRHAIKNTAMLQAKPLPQSSVLNDGEPRQNSLNSQTISQGASAQPQTINNYVSGSSGSSGDGLLTGVILGSMLSSGREHTVTHEVIREVSVSSDKRGSESSNRTVGAESSSSNRVDSNVDANTSIDSSWDSGGSGLDSSWGDSGGGSGDD